MPVDFDDLTKRILDNLDNINKKVTDLCDRMLKVEINLNNHFKEVDDKTANKEKKFYVIIAGMGITFTLVEVLQGII
jgi:2-hydroxy-3-keto-5-methylthiopentenyl-1-phosphate phosphatase